MQRHFNAEILDQSGRGRETASYVTWLWICLGVLLVLHIVGVGSYPLMGTTEGRYAEMARKMVESGEYWVPMFTDSQPFWGKPPLSIWLTSLSLHWFGANAFAARLPSYVCALVVVALTVFMSRERSDRVAVLSAVLFAGSLLGYSGFGKVHTDAALAAAVAAAMFGMYKGFVSGRVSWYVMGFLGISAGFLAKGPVTLVYVGLPVIAWLFWHGALRESLASLKLWLFACASVVLVAPWYLVAEHQFPGYLEYFFFGEHIARYTEPGWQGDLYGAGHQKPKGMVFLFAAEGLLPWSVLVPVLLTATKSWKRVIPKQGLAEVDPMISLYWCWALTPLLFFALSANVVSNYVLPVLAPLCVLSALALNQCISRRVVTCIVIGALAIPAAKTTQHLNWEHWYVGSRNQKLLVDAMLRAQQADEPLVYLGERRYAAEFYAPSMTLISDLSELRPGPAVLGMRPSKTPLEPPGRCRVTERLHEYRVHRCE